MFEKLLVATDLSPRSDRAMQRAFTLLDGSDAALFVLHVLDEELPSSVAHRLKDESESLIDGYLQSVAGAKKRDVTRKVVFGTPFREILREADDTGAGLVIMGTHRTDILGDFFLGTTVERVIRYGNAAVLVVRDRAKAPYRRVLVGVDFSVCSRRAVEFALNLVPHGEIYLVHAFDVPFGGFLSEGVDREAVERTRRKQMKAMLETEMQAFFNSLASRPARLEPLLIQGTVREVILGQVDALRPDLLVLGTHGRTGIAHSFLGSVAEDLLSDPPCDVLAVKAW